MACASFYPSCFLVGEARRPAGSVEGGGLYAETWLPWAQGTPKEKWFLEGRACSCPCWQDTWMGAWTSPKTKECHLPTPTQFGVPIEIWPPSSSSCGYSCCSLFSQPPTTRLTTSVPSSVEGHTSARRAGLLGDLLAAPQLAPCPV